MARWHPARRTGRRLRCSGAQAPGAFTRAMARTATRERPPPAGQERLMTANAFHELPGPAGLVLLASPWDHSHDH